MNNKQIILNLYVNQSAKRYADFMCIDNEFTHILDTERYVRKDKIKNIMYRGFTEYHAGQIDLLKLLGEKRVDEHYSFSMQLRLENVGNPKTVEEFVDAAHDTATSLINREDFPADVETLSITIGLIFNYWGRRSICKMYAVDYAEKVDNATIEKLIGSERYKTLDELTNGWLDEEQIKRMAESYFELIVSKMKEYSL